MALDLTLKITADATDAKRELKAVEKQIKDVETTAAKSTPATSKVMQALATDTGKVSQAQQKLVDTSKMSTSELIEHTKQLVRQDAAAINAAKSQGKMAETMVVSTAATRGLLASTNLWVGALAVAGAGILALIGVVSKSAQFYLEHADAMEENRRAISSVQTAWEAFQFVVGRAAIGENSIARPINLFNLALVSMGLELARRIDQMRQLVDVGARLFGVTSDVLKGPDPNRDPRALFIDPSATARGGMEANRQYRRDMLEMERAANELAEQRFQERKRANDARIKRLKEEAQQRQELEAILRGAGVPITTGFGLGNGASLDWLEDIQSRLNLGPLAGFPRVGSGLDGLSLPGGVDLGLLGIPGFKPTLMQSLFGSSSQFGGNLAGAIMGAFQGGGNPISAMGSMVGGQFGSSLAGMLTGGGGIAIGGLAGGALNAILPGIGTLLGPLLGKALGGLKKLFGGGSEGRDLIEQAFPDLNALHRQLNELGADGERLWIMLTQGVGKNNPAQARAAIDAVTQALERHRQKQIEVEEAVVKAAQKEVDAQAKVIAEIEARKEASDRKIAALSQAIAQEAAEAEMGIIEKQQREELAREQEHRSKIQNELDEANKKQEENIKRLADAMDSLTRALQGLTSHPWDIKVNVIEKEGEDQEQPENSFANGTNGYRWFGSGTRAMLHGWEKVVPLGKETSGEPMVIQIQIGDREFADVWVDTATRKYRTRYRVGTS